MFEQKLNNFEIILPNCQVQWRETWTANCVQHFYRKFLDKNFSNVFKTLRYGNMKRSLKIFISFTKISPISDKSLHFSHPFCHHGFFESHMDRIFCHLDTMNSEKKERIYSHLWFVSMFGFFLSAVAFPCESKHSKSKQIQVLTTHVKHKYFER